MNEQEIRQLVEKILDEKDYNDSFTTSDAPNHTHNGLDSPRINLVNAIPNNKFRVGINGDNSGGSSSISGGQTLTAGILNPSSLKFFGYATNGVTGVMIAGAAELGVCFDVNASAVIDSKDTVEACSFTSDSFAGQAPYLAYYSDGTERIRLTISEWDNTSIRFVAYLDAGWQLLGNVLIT